MSIDRTSFMCNGKLFQTWAPEYRNAACSLFKFILGVIKLPFLADLVSYEWMVSHLLNIDCVYSGAVPSVILYMREAVS